MPTRHIRSRARTALVRLPLVTALGLAMAATGGIPGTVDASTATTKIVRCDDVNLRTGPSTSKRVVAKLDAGVKVTVVATVEGAAWQAECNGTVVKGTKWHRISAVAGSSADARYGVDVVYGAAGLFKSPATDPYGAELMRLIALDRKALGRPALIVDERLVALARGKSFTCPTKSSMTIRGRAVDMATRGYFSHSIKGCYKADGSLYRGTDILARLFGRPERRSEIIHWNSYASEAATYRIGCDIEGRDCSGDTTRVVNRVAIAQRSFMSSAVHRSAELDRDYTRFGCGSGRTPDTNKTYFTCFFTKGLPTP